MTALVTVKLAEGGMTVVSVVLVGHGVGSGSSAIAGIAVTTGGGGTQPGPPQWAVLWTTPVVDGAGRTEKVAVTESPPGTAGASKVSTPAVGPETLHVVAVGLPEQAAELLT